MRSGRRLLAAICIPLLLGIHLLCVCPHALRSAAAAHASCHSEEAPAPASDSQRSPSCPHCGDHELALAAAKPDAERGVAHSPLPPMPAMLASRGAVPRALLCDASPAGIGGRALLARQRVLRI